jgi:hypothetical protein
VSDRLKAWLDEGHDGQAERCVCDKTLHALRAVVELAEPTRDPKYHYHPEYTLAMLHVLGAIEKEVFGG